MTHIFLSYAREDKETVGKLYLKLRKAGLSAWMDKPPSPYDLDGIRPGERWDTVVRQKMREASHLLVFLSKASVSKRGYVQREYQLALSLAMERPSGDRYLIPVLLDECDPPNHRVDNLSLDQFDWYRLYESSPEKLVDYLKVVANAQVKHDTAAVKETLVELTKGEALVKDGEEGGQRAAETDPPIDPFANRPKSNDPTVIGLRNQIRLLTSQLAQKQGENAILGTQLHLLKHQLRECLEKPPVAVIPVHTPNKDRSIA